MMMNTDGLMKESSILRVVVMLRQSILTLKKNLIFTMPLDQGLFLRTSLRIKMGPLTIVMDPSLKIQESHILSIIFRT